MTQASEPDFKGKRLLFTHEMHAFRCGREYYNPGSMISYKNLAFYLHAFEDATALVRFQGDRERPEPQWHRLDGEQVDIEPIPDIRSIAQLVRHFPAIWRAVGRAMKRTDRFMVRLPGVAGTAVALALMLRGRKYGAEFVGHPTESVIEMLRVKGRKPGLTVKLLDWGHRFLIRHAVAVGYVSHRLKEQYPNKNAEREVVISPAHPSPEVITGPREEVFFRQAPLRILYLGRISPEKGLDVLIRAFAQCVGRLPVALKLRVVGDGPDRAMNENLAEKLGVAQDVEFTGMIPWGEQLFSTLDDSHLYAIPSYTEGLPRSLIEAMMRGMPSVGSNRGGIPELITADCLVPAGEPEALAAKMLELLGDPERLAKLSCDNFEASRPHWPEELGKAKDVFWKLILDHAK